MYGVQTVGIQSGFNDDSNNSYYQAANAGVAAGAVQQFACFMALQNRGPNFLNAALCGTNTDGTSGWLMGRSPDSPQKQALYTVVAQLGAAPASLTVTLSLPTVVGKSMLLGLSVDGTILSVWLNGAIVDQVGGIGAYVPSPAPFVFGNLPFPGSNGAVDRLIAFAYTDTLLLTEQQQADVWNDFRETGSLRFAGTSFGGWGYSYEAFDIAAPPSLIAPATLPNGGTVLTGDLTWKGDRDKDPAFSMTVDSDPDYTQVLSEISP